MGAKGKLLVGVGAGLVAAMGATLWSHTVFPVGILVWTGILIPCGIATAFLVDRLFRGQKTIGGAKGLRQMFGCMIVGVVVFYFAAVVLNLTLNVLEPFAPS